MRQIEKILLKGIAYTCTAIAIIFLIPSALFFQWVADARERLQIIRREEECDID